MELRCPRGYEFDRMVGHIAGLMLSAGDRVDTGHWQSLKDVPQTDTIELRNVSVVYALPLSVDRLASEVKPNLPWADLHFKERVGGQPTNPGATYHLWPYFRGNVPKHQGDGDQFSHTYMERFWPRYAGMEPETIATGYHDPGLQGIRYRYGDLMDVVNLLAAEPFTRQAYLPVWFPEDTGAHESQRVPCTLGYHFMRRGNLLHCFYPIRSCDLLRHFRDDVYLAGRLVLWMLDQLGWDSVIPGEVFMHAHSLHVFTPERPVLRRLAGLTDNTDEFVAGAV